VISLKTTNIIAVILIAVVLIASTYGAYRWYAQSPSPTPSTKPTTEPTIMPTQTPTVTETSTISPTTPPTKTPEPTTPSTIKEKAPTYALVTDCYGGTVNVTLPVNRIACINNGFTEIIFALGCGDKLVGRDVYSTYPRTVENITIFYSASGLSMETLAELNVSLVITDTRVNNETRAQIENTLKVPVIIDNPSDSNRVESLVLSLGIILDKEDRAQSLLNYMNNINNLVATRLSTLKETDKPLVYYEWSKAWYSCSSAGLPHVMVTQAGGINLAANETVTYPTLSSEYVLERNPSVVLRIITSTPHNQTDFITMRNSLMARTGLSGTSAAINGRVYVMEGLLRTGIRNPIGLLVMAKCFYPSLFTDINPETLQDEMFMTFIGEHTPGTYYYPT
jgi:iron complex transport system substrate-binding protein